MGFNNFRFQTVARVALIAATLGAASLLYFGRGMLATPFVLVGLALVQVALLVHYVEKTNRDIVHFLDSIRYSDFTRSFRGQGKGRSFDDLSGAFNQVVHEFQKLRAEKEEHYFYLQNIIQHIGIAVIAYRRDGKIEMINNAGKRLFQVAQIKNIGELRTWSQRFVDLLFAMKAGENTLIKVQDGDDLLQLAVYATEFKINDRTITLVSIKNIQAELEEQEMEAWQKLIRVLTHEIMNSIAPIASLSSTATMLVNHISQTLETSPEELDLELLADIQHAIRTIGKRSQGLIEFVETYRNLTRIPKPNFTIFPVQNLIDSIQSLLREEFREQQIHFSSQVEPPTIMITADENLMEQVLLNMVKNAQQALAESPQKRIWVKAHVNPRGRTILQVCDNGPGIVDEVREKIFIPFFTTKREGTGIGLSLSRQIIRQHNGTISVQSQPGHETIFTITL